MVVGMILAGSALVISAGTAIYEAFFDEDVINNYKTINQNDYITNETTFDFSESYFENGSNISLSTYLKNNSEKNATQKDITSSNNNLLYLGLAVGVGLYLYNRRSKK